MSVAIDPTIVKWSDADRLAGRPLLLLLHGYGRDEDNLDAIAAAIAGPDGDRDGPSAANTIVTSQLRGPRPSRAPLLGGYGWHDVDERIIPIPGQSEETAAAVLGWLDAVIAERGEPSSIGLCGFSQGAAFSLTLLRTAPERFQALVTLAGFWAPGTFGGEARLAELRPPIFWGRSDRDPAIDPAYVDATRAALAPIAPEAEHVYSDDTHSVLPAMVADAAAFLRVHLG